MAGLQQYNFFPTDFFYPRPQPSAATLETASVKPKVLPLQTPKGETIRSEDLHDLQSQTQQQPQPRSMIKVPPPTALVYNQKRQSLSGVDKKVSKFSTNSLSWVAWMAEEF